MVIEHLCTVLHMRAGALGRCSLNACHALTALCPCCASPLQDGASIFPLMGSASRLPVSLPPLQVVVDIGDGDSRYLR